ncbi:MAG: dipicolinate synthase subunit DpsA [Roseburia sp.]
MNGQTVLFISDMRQVYLADILNKKGHTVRCLDIRDSRLLKEQILKLQDFLPEAEMLILPIPVTKLTEQELFMDVLNKKIRNETLVLGGCFPETFTEWMEQRGISYLDFMEDETVVEENSVATAEGAIADVILHSPYNIRESKIIVSGYGKCGKAIAERLQALGARVTILARKRESRKAAKSKGFYAADFAFGPEEAMGANVLINTVPAPVITELIIRELPKDAYLLDIASKPGGIDFQSAKEHGIQAELLLGIPGRYAPMESAYILARAIERFSLRKSNVK